MKRSTKKFITDLRRNFREADDKGRKEMWDILTALRGPDNENSQEKSATTAVIRYMLLGEKTYKTISKLALVHPDSKEKADYRYNYKKGILGHFGIHAVEAFTALGLKWDEVNE